MSGAIFFSGKYVSTEQYANWAGEATRLFEFDIKDTCVDFSKYEFLVLGSSILYSRLTNGKWARVNLNYLRECRVPEKKL